MSLVSNHKVKNSITAAADKIGNEMTVNIFFIL